MLNDGFLLIGCPVKVIINQRNIFQFSHAFANFHVASYRTASPVSALLGLALFGCNEINKQLGVLLIRASLNQGHSIRHSAGSILRIYKSYRRVILVLHSSLLQGQSHIELTVSHHLMALA